MNAPDFIQNIPLDKLVKSPRNVRRTPPSETAEAELKASIAVHGLQQNLVVAPANGDGVHEVIAGGRRLAALKALQAEGKLPADCVVPCFIRRENAAEISLAENIVRQAMHPADQFEAFAGLVDAGETVPAIASRFGVSERLVRQRLKLGKVAPKLLAAYRAEEMDLETLTAFTLTDNHRRQLAVWKQVKNEHYGVSHHTVRRLLTEKSIAAGSRLGRFIGAEAYEQAGGSVTRDLFSERDDGYFDDVKLVQKLALKKLETKAKELEANWKWAKPLLEPDYGFTAEFARVYPEPVDVPAEVTEELERLDQREDELMNLDEDDWTEELEAEADQIATRREELQQLVQAHTAYSDEDRKRAGCVVTIGHDGDFQVYEGLIPRDEVSVEDDGGFGGEPDETPSDRPADAPLSGEQSVRKANGFSQVLIDDLNPDSSSVVLDNLPATDRAGYAGLEDEVDFHTWSLIKGIALATLLGVGTELAFDEQESDLVRALRESAQDNANQAGQQIVQRYLNIQPTITIRPGWPLRIIVNKDIVLRPYRG